MSLAAIRTRIHTTLSAVAGIGTVHKRRRLVFDDDEINELLVKDRRLNAWFISLAPGEPLKADRRGPGYEHVSYRWRLECWYAFNDADASEEAFDNIVEAVIAAFRADKKLGHSVIDSGPCNWSRDEMAFYPKEGGTLCHYAELILPVHEQSEPTP